MTFVIGMIQNAISDESKACSEIKKVLDGIGSFSIGGISIGSSSSSLSSGSGSG